MQIDPSLLGLRNLAVTYGSQQAVVDFSIEIKQGECVGLVGESGCGKTSVARSIVGLVTPSSGEIRYHDKAINTFNEKQWLQYRKNVQMVFQDPYASLNPRMTAGAILAEVLYVHGMKGRHQRQQRVEGLLHLVGLDPSYAHRFPHEFSGGQRQRIGIARAMAVEPELIIADEPVSALDVSMQAQILNVIKQICNDTGVSCLFIAHDLAVVQYMCDRVIVMNAGRIMEEGRVSEIFNHPQHPYTKMLLDAVPDVEKGLKIRKGTIKKATSMPST